MLRKIKRLMPKSVINYGKHLPEAIIASTRYGFPSRRLHIIGVTGTDGKTTTVNMIYSILKAAGKKVSMISTINATVGGKSYDTGFHVTSPSSFDLQKFVNMAVKLKEEYIVLEVTSHALEQFRIWGIKLDVAVITNITHEHLDYHGTFENYVQTKAKILKNTGISVLNMDDQSFAFLEKKAKGRIISFGEDNRADINNKNLSLHLKMFGSYNIYNALAAAAVAKALGIDEDIIKKTLENFESLPGRMEEIENNKGIKVVVDFAHTPNALENALKSLRRATKGRLIAVFGCASERDIEKRPMMGGVAGKLADITVLTDEDPRFENSDKIIEEIARGFFRVNGNSGGNLFREPDREEAIKIAINMAKKGDTVGIFGKGCEQSMNYKGIEKPWSDRKYARKVLLNGQ